MSYLTDDAIEDRCRFINSIAPNNDEVSYMGGAEWVRDLYESHLKEKDELLREAAKYVKHEEGCQSLGYWTENLHKRMYVEGNCTCAVSPLLSRINSHLKP